MATELKKPVTRELTASQIGDLLGIQANRALVVTMNSHGLSIKAKGRHGDGALIPWDKILGHAWGGMGMSVLRKELK